MIQTDGLAILYAWLLFAALLSALGFVVLKGSARSDRSGDGRQREVADDAAGEQVGRRRDTEFLGE
jgi:hypothetical protein